MLSKISTILGIGLCSAMLFSGCSSDDSDSGKIVFPAPSEGEEQKLQGPELELAFNYELLSFFYFYSHLNQELDTAYTVYKNAPYLQNYGWSACTIDYADVCYMYAHMSDLYTRYYDPTYAAYVLNQIMETEQLVGIGIEMKEKTIDDNNAIVVTQVYEGSSAALAGLQVNDIILEIDGTSPKTLKAAEALLGGREGDVIELKVSRDGEEITLKTELATYKQPTVYVSYEESIPVIRITEFTSVTASDSGTYGEFVTALKKTEGAKATIIDLRGNPGGDVDQCNNVSSELLAEGDTIITDIETTVDSILEKDEWYYFQSFDTVTYTVARDGIAKDRYYVFMADSGSASCAELMLSAVTVNKKSPVVGLTTFGKGIGQYIYPTQLNGLALITGLQSMDKFGKIYHKVGIVPDLVTGDSEEQMSTAIEWAKEGTKIRTAGYGTESTGHFAKARSKSSANGGLPQSRAELLRQMGGKLIFKNIKK